MLVYRTNLKYTNFKGAKLKEVNFFNCEIKCKNFENVFFISTKVDDVKNLTLGTGCICIKSYPQGEISYRLKNAILRLTECKTIYDYYVLHVNKKKLNIWNISLLKVVIG